jgi:hypothetical protein
MISAATEDRKHGKNQEGQPYRPQHPNQWVDLPCACRAKTEPIICGGAGRRQSKWDGMDTKVLRRPAVMPEPTGLNRSSETSSSPKESPMTNLSFGPEQDSGCKKFRITALSIISLRKDARIAGIPT